jgi:conjugal transfer mating pair stabilization protein TraG
MQSCRQRTLSIDTFRSSGDRTSDAESALAQAALHAANANNQIGTAREQSLAESNAYRENTIK